MKQPFEDAKNETIEQYEPALLALSGDGSTLEATTEDKETGIKFTGTVLILDKPTGNGTIYPSEIISKIKETNFYPLDKEDRPITCYTRAKERLLNALKVSSEVAKQSHE